jgi:hypothetical protein
MRNCERGAEGREEKEEEEEEKEEILCWERSFALT